MTDDLGNRGPQDASRISMTEDYEVEYWTKQLNVSRERLEEAVDAVGNSAAAVTNYLNQETQA